MLSFAWSKYQPIFKTGAFDWSRRLKVMHFSL